MNPEKISKIIKEIRLKSGMTQKEFADKYNVTYQAVSKWENAKNLPDVSILKEICQDFNLDINELLGNEINKKKSKGRYLAVIGFAIVIILLIERVRVRAHARARAKSRSKAIRMKTAKIRSPLLMTSRNT